MQEIWEVHNDIEYNNIIHTGENKKYNRPSLPYFCSKSHLPVCSLSVPVQLDMEQNSPLICLCGSESVGS